MSLRSSSIPALIIFITFINIDLLLQDYYCESLGQMFIINTPTVFRLIWAVVNPMLEERTRRKIIILGSDYMPTITQLIPEDNLPACLGGKGARTVGAVGMGADAGGVECGGVDRGVWTGAGAWSAWVWVAGGLGRG